MSCFADWSKHRHVTFIVIEWSMRHGRLCIITMIHGYVTFTKCKHKIYSTLFRRRYTIFKLVVGHTTKQMKHGRSCDIEIWWPSVVNLGFIIFQCHTLTTVHHLYTVAEGAICCRCLQIFRFCASPHSQRTASAGALFVGTFLFDKAGLARAAIFIPWANMRQLLHRQCTVSTFITLRDRFALTPRQTVAIKHHARPRQLP